MNRGVMDWLIAHRGWPEAWPENSLAGMRAVLEAGARQLEFDVQLSADGVPMVAHDDDLARVGAPHCRVTRMTAEALAGCPNGEPDRFGERFAEQTLPSLAAMLALLAEWPGVTVFVELKRASLRRFGHAAVLDAVLACLRDCPNPWVLISFDALAVEMARSRGAQGVGWVFKPWSDRARQQAHRLRPDYLFVRQDRVPAGPRPFWPGDWRWVVYGVNRPESAQSWRDRGVDGVETDRLPDLARELIRASAGASSHE